VIAVEMQRFFMWVDYLTVWRWIKRVQVSCQHYATYKLRKSPQVRVLLKTTAWW